MSKPIYSIIDQPFGLDVITIPDPGAGLNFSFLMPFEYLYRLLSVEFLFTTDATVINRLVTFTGNIGSKAINRSQSSLSQAATKAYTYSICTRQIAFVAAVLNDRISMSLSQDFLLPPGSTVSSDIDSIQAGDAITGIVLLLQWFPIPK